MINTLKSFVIYCDIELCERSEHITCVADEMAAELEAIRQGWSKLEMNKHICPRCFLNIGQIPNEEMKS